MEWIRCNNCYARADITKEPFSLTKCGHVYCSRCISGAERQCPICNTVNVPTLLLREPLDSGVASYFRPLGEQMQQILVVCKFQEEQLLISTKRFNELGTKYEYCKEVCRKLQIGVMKLHNECKQDKEKFLRRLHDLEKENMQLKITLNEDRNSPYGNYRSAQSSASSLLNSHTCTKRCDVASSDASSLIRERLELLLDLKIAIQRFYLRHRRAPIQTAPAECRRIRMLNIYRHMRSQMEYFGFPISTRFQDPQASGHPTAQHPRR